MRIAPPHHLFSKINWLLASFILSIALASCSAKDDSGSLIISMPDSSAARSLSSSGSLGDDYVGGDTKVYTVAVRDKDNNDIEVFKNVTPGSVLTITDLMPGTYNVAIRMIMTGSDNVIYYGATEAVVKGGTENVAHIKMDSASNCCNCRIKFDQPSPDIQNFTAIITCENGDHYYISGGFPEDDDEGGGLFERHLVVEFALDHGDRVDGEVAVDAADVELTLVETLEGAFQTEGGTAIPTTGEEQQPQEHRYDSKTLFHHLILLTSRSFSAYLARASSRLVALRKASLASAVLPIR